MLTTTVRTMAPLQTERSNPQKNYAEHTTVSVFLFMGQEFKQNE